MSIIEQVPTAVPDTYEADRRRGRRRWLGAGLAVVLLCVGLVTWWLVTTPKLEGGGLASVSSEDHDVFFASGLRETVYVVPADGPGRSTLAFGIHNRGRLAVEIVDVWPSSDQPACFWEPSERWFQDDPQLVGVLDDRARPAAGAVLEPGRLVALWVTGAHPDPGRCVHGGITMHDHVDVVVRISGRTSTTRVPLGYTFGYSDDPASLRDRYETGVRSPTRSPSS